MRIALLTRRFDPAGGGTERDLMVTADSLRRAGHEISIYASEVRATSADWPVRQVGGGAPSRAIELMRFAFAAPIVARQAGAHLVLSFARTVGADVLRSGGGPHARYVRAARQWRGELRGAAMWLSPYHRAQMFVERRGMKHPALRKVIAVSDLVRRALLDEFGLPPDKVVTLYNGVDLDRFKPASTGARRNEIRVKLEIGAATPVAIFVGNGFARKGLGFLIEAWPRLKNAAALLIIGNDRTVARFKARSARLGVDRRMFFMGPQREVEALFQVADIAVLPSLFEPFGNVALEAMASGLPALVSSRCGVAEILPDTMKPFVVGDPTDPGQIADKLDALIEHVAEAAKASRPAAAQFTWQRYTEGLLAVLDSVA